MSETVKTILLILGGGLLTFIAAMYATRSNTRIALRKADGDKLVALEKVSADRKTADRNVGLEELKAACLRLAEENKQLREDGKARDARIDALEATGRALESEHGRLRESEQKCQLDLAHLRGQFDELKSRMPVVTLTTAAPAVPAAQPEGA